MHSTFSALTLAVATVFQLTAARAVTPELPPATVTGPNNATLQRALDRQLNKHVVFPLLDREHDMTGSVDVTFVINTEGRIELLSATSDNDVLCDYVLRKLAQVDIGDNPSGSWKTSHVRFVFRPEA